MATWIEIRKGSVHERLMCGNAVFSDPFVDRCVMMCAINP